MLQVGERHQPGTALFREHDDYNDERQEADELDDGECSDSSSSQGSSLTLRPNSPTMDRPISGHTPSLGPPPPPPPPTTTTSAKTINLYRNHHSTTHPVASNKTESPESGNNFRGARMGQTEPQRKQREQQSTSQQQQQQGQTLEQANKQKSREHQQRIQQFARRPPLQISQSFSDVESSFSSCFNQSGFTVLNQDQLMTLATALDRNHSQLANRQQALRHLVHLPIIDIQACEAWSAPGVTLENAESNAREQVRRDTESPKQSDSRKERNTWMDKTTTQSNKWLHDSDMQPSSSYPLVGGNLRTGLADALNDPDETLWVRLFKHIDNYAP
ncbi:unnamed protein product [Echinostoma caproni]|uniref:Uncharacterized protein n=1 Tax=Echinostoma caproni TaxID=27848 RepID=A0A183A732_9TREM|nr:unnamed protein product [Echinostoma caproni]